MPIQCITFHQNVQSEGKLYSVPSGDLVNQLYDTAGQLLNLTYKAGKLYDTEDNLVTSLLKVSLPVGRYCN